MSPTDTKVTASMLYDLVMCEHRPWMDRYADPSLRDEASPFVELLWRRGRAHEEETISSVGGTLLNLRQEPLQLREKLTLEAMARREPLIYGGRIAAEDLLGEPDLLRYYGAGYVPGDIKSGAADEGPSSEQRKPKVHYAVQLALYVDILERLHFSGGRRAFVWDVHGDEVEYDLVAPKGAKSGATLWDDYTGALLAAREIVAGTRNPGAAYSAACKQCRWYSACISELKRRDDLTLLPGLGRSKREPLRPYARTISEFAALSPTRLLDDKGKSRVKGLGPGSLAKFHARAALHIAGGPPYLKAPIDLPQRALELFFDLETDPMRDHCYLHGFVERRNRDNGTERYVGFFSSEPTPESERQAFATAWDYVRSMQPCTLYIYSKYERTWWRALQQRHPSVCGPDEIEELFNPANTVDLFQVVEEATEWPTIDHSIKTLARFLGFEWRDAHPSGAASIEWYDRHVQGDPTAKARILEYNEDDCVAMRVLLDGLTMLRLNSQN